MYKIRNQFMHFRFNANHQHGPYSVEWYKLEESEQDQFGVCLSNDELTQLTNYFAQNNQNFTDQNYTDCDPDDVPFCGIYDLVPTRNRIPTNLILKRVPKLLHNGVIYHCMEIELLTPGGALKNTANLPFDIIGKILL